MKKVHNEILKMVDIMVSNRNKRYVVKNYVFNHIHNRIPDSEYLTTRELCLLFGRTPDYFTNLLRSKREVDIIVKGRAFKYKKRDILKDYFITASTLPLNVVAKYLQREGYMNSVTFYARFSSDYYDKTQFFSERLNFFDQRALTLMSVYDIFLWIKQEKYIKENWCTIESLADRKKVSDHTICDWINSGLIKNVYKVGKKIFISPYEENSVLNTKKFSDRNRLRYQARQKVELNREFYVEQFNLLKKYDFRTMSLENQKLILMAGKARIRGSIEYLLDAYSGAIRSVAWDMYRLYSIRREMEIEELIHFGTIGIMSVCDRFHEEIDHVNAYIFSTIKWEVKKPIFKLLQEKKIIKNYDIDLGRYYTKDSTF